MTGGTMQVDASIFKAYDIRGIYNQSLFDDTAELIAKSFTEVIKPETVIVGRDGRVSGPALHKRLTETLLDLGINVIDIGQVSTDMYYYACQQKQLPGIMITASHNPKEYNGFKMVKRIPYLLSGDEGIQDMLKAIQEDRLPAASETKGTMTQWNVMNEFVQFLLTLVDVSKLKPMKLAIDPANGMVGPILKEFFKHVPQMSVKEMYWDVDGTFPNHGGDPLIAENRREVEEAVVKENLDIGFLFDPDGDRFFTVDGQGRFISGDFMTAILSEYFLKRDPGAKIVYDIRASKAVPEIIVKNGGVPLYNKVGHSFIKKRMSDEGAVFGGEVSGHYYFKDFYLCDTGIIAMMYVLDYLSHSDKTLAQIVNEMEQTYHISGEINNKVASVPAKLAEIEELYASKANNVIKVDGITCEFDTWRFNVRGSNTEPLIRLNLEADTVEEMEQKRDELLSVITS